MAIPRRVTLNGGSAATGSGEPSADTPVGEQPSAYLLRTLEGVAECVRAGQYAANERDGVLVDTVVGSARCLLLVHEPSSLVQLSPREHEVARMVAGGQAIASALDISVWTVSTHLRRIFAKLGVCSRAEMVAHLLGRRPDFGSSPIAVTFEGSPIVGSGTNRRG